MTVGEKTAASEQIKVQRPARLADYQPSGCQLPGLAVEADIAQKCCGSDFQGDLTPQTGVELLRLQLHGQDIARPEQCGTLKLGCLQAAFDVADHLFIQCHRCAVAQAPRKSARRAQSYRSVLKPEWPQASDAAAEVIQAAVALTARHAHAKMSGAGFRSKVAGEPAGWRTNRNSGSHVQGPRRRMRCGYMAAAHLMASAANSWNRAE